MKKLNKIAAAVMMSMVLSVCSLSGCSGSSDGTGNAGASNTANSGQNSTVSDIGQNSAVSSPAVSDGSSEQVVSDSDLVFEDFLYEKSYYYDDPEADDSPSHECIMIRKYLGNSPIVTVPDDIEGIKVCLIDNNAFEGSQAEEIVFPDSIIDIGYACMRDCTNLKEVTLPKSLKTITTEMFKRCTSLKSIELPEGLKLIEDGAFCGCEALEDIKIPESVTEIQSWAFQDCTSLKNFMFPSKLEVLGDDVLFNTAILNEAPYGENYIGNVFYCYKFEGLLRDDKYESVKKLAEQGKFTFRDGTRIIATYAFYNDSTKEGLPACDFEIPDSVIYIGSAFSYINIGTININASVAKSVGIKFDGCTVKEIKFDENVTEIGESFFSNSDIENVEIPSSVRKINESAFNISRIKNIFIHEGTEYIGQLAFTSCEKLEKVYIPSTVKEFGEGYTYSFDGSPNAVIYTTAGSEAEKYAQQYNIPCKIIAGEEEFKF